MPAPRRLSFVLLTGTLAIVATVLLVTRLDPTRAPLRGFEHAERGMAPGEEASDPLLPGHARSSIDRDPSSELPPKPSRRRDRVLAKNDPASIAGRVTGSPPDQHGLRIAAETTRLPIARWSAPVAYDGGYRLSDLPPRAAIVLSLRSDQRSFVHDLPTPIVLEPGEERTIDWPLDRLGSIVGVVREEDGAAAAGVELWLLPAFDVSGGMMPEYAKSPARTLTDARGHFTIPRVMPGSWVLGPASQRQRAGRAADDSPPARFATTIEVPEGGGKVDAKLVLHRGHTIEGVVLGPDGTRVADATVTAWRANGGHAYTSSRGDGSFTLGPLEPGLHVVSARGVGLLARSAQVPVRVDERGVVLRLMAGCRVAGRVVDGRSGEEVRAQVQARAVDGHMSRGVYDASTFDLGGLDPGPYDLVATTRNGRFGTLRTLLEPGRAREGLVVRVAPGGWIEILYRGPEELADFAVESDGTVAQSGTVRSGILERRVCPPGPATVRLATRSDPATGVQRSVQVVPGEVRLVEIDLRD